MNVTPVEYDQQVLEVIQTPGIIGIDEAGRGALAGPVVAAAVFVSQHFYAATADCAEVNWINDSKCLKPARRLEVARLAEQWQQAQLLYYSAAQASVEEIDQLNILGATQLAMRRALEAVFIATGGIRDWPAPALLVDGRPLRSLGYAHRALVGGDGLSFSIGLASIIAKVHRDHLMEEINAAFDCYGFSVNKGYGVKSHCEAIVEHGPCHQHRPLFLRKLMEKQRQRQLEL